MTTLPAGVTQRLILIRHGEPEEAARGRCYGKLDVGLSARGVAQIARVAQHLRDVPLSAIYSSPRRRASESAAVIAQSHALEVKVEDALAEIDFGAFEGLTYDEVAAKFPVEYSMWMQHPTRVQFPDGESFAQMQRRVRAVIKRIRARHRGQTVAVISHGGVNRIVLAAALGIKSRDIFRIGQCYASVNVIDFYDATPQVQLMNFDLEAVSEV